MSDDALIWRSQLYVPANNQRFIDKAFTRGADAIILDLEDSVPASEREGARARLEQSVQIVGQAGADVTVRINSSDDEILLDLQAAVLPQVRGIFVTKVRDADYIRAISSCVGELEAASGMAPGSICLIAMIETAAAYMQAYDIARADPRIAAMVLGGEDFALDLGMVPDADTLSFPKQHIAIAARAAGVAPFGILGTVADYSDGDAVWNVAERSSRFGFEGASCIHPDIVPVLNAAFTPGEAEIDHARRVVAAYEEAEAAGTGAIAVDGKMVDVPVVRRAKNLLLRFEAIERRSG
ncbi:MAG: HpcH/HpaI aldolase/citrate lyase family protein [Alphaproteobacteria bacterium]